jgi:hypothetical protein
MSNGLFDQMAADAEAFDTVTTESGSKLSNLIREAQQQQSLQEQHEQAAKDAKKEFQRITRELIPAEMIEMGMDRVDVDGNSVSLSQFVYASIPEARKEEAFNFLRSIGEDDIIKNEVKVSFGRGQDNQAGAFVDDCMRQGLDPDNRKSVHPSTLKAWIKDKLGTGTELDLDMFGAYVGTEAKIKRK